MGATMGSWDTQQDLLTGSYQRQIPIPQRLAVLILPSEADWKKQIFLVALSLSQ